MIATAEIETAQAGRLTGNDERPDDAVPLESGGQQMRKTQRDQLPHHQQIERQDRGEHDEIGRTRTIAQRGSGDPGVNGPGPAGDRDRSIGTWHAFLRPPEPAGYEILVPRPAGVGHGEVPDPGGGEQRRDLGAHPPGPVHPDVRPPPALETLPAAVRLLRRHGQRVELGPQPITLPQLHPAQRGTDGGVVDHSVPHELIDQRTRPRFVESRPRGRPHRLMEVSCAVQPVEPASYLRRELAEHHGSPWMRAVLEGAFVADDPPQRRFHSWPHGGEAAMPERPAEPWNAILWITGSPLPLPVDNPLRSWSMSELLVDRRDDGIVILTLNRPDRRNSMTEEMTARWRETIAALAVDAEVRCVVVTGAGSAFSAGGDMPWLAERGGESVPELRGRMLDFYRTWLSITKLEIPTIAAVNGAAVGAGLCLALACDLVYAAEDARLLAPFTRLGLHPGMAATHLLPNSAGLRLARELLFTGRTILGAEAARRGLINQAFPSSDLISEVLDFAAMIAGNAPIATRLTKVALSQEHQDLEAALRWESLAQPVTMASADMREGLAANRERRPPQFSGT